MHRWQFQIAFWSCLAGWIVSPTGKTVRTIWVTDRTLRSKSTPKKARLESLSKRTTLIGVDCENPRPGEIHPNYPLDLMGDPYFLDIQCADSSPCRENYRRDYFVKICTLTPISPLTPISHPTRQTHPERLYRTLQPNHATRSARCPPLRQPQRCPRSHPQVDDFIQRGTPTRIPRKPPSIRLQTTTNQTNQSRLNL